MRLFGLREPGNAGTSLPLRRVNASLLWLGHPVLGVQLALVDCVG